MPRWPRLREVIWQPRGVLRASVRASLRAPSRACSGVRWRSYLRGRLTSRRGPISVAELDGEVSVVVEVARDDVALHLVYGALGQ
jgi:hypothetical protein